MNAGDRYLDVQGLSVHYGAYAAVDDVSFFIRPGETVGLVGESGSGKTTIGRAILALAKPTSGRILLDGEDITWQRDKRKVSRKLQAVFQNPYGSLNPAKTIGQTLAEPLIAHESLNRSEVVERVRAQLRRVGLNDSHADRYPVEFSGGQRQRIAIARALMLSPRLVICDEPTSALDLSVQAMLLNLMRDLQEELSLSYLFISHDLSVVRYLCDRIVVLSGGRVMESGDAEQVSQEPMHPYTQALLDSEPMPDRSVQAQKRAMRVSAVPKTTGLLGGQSGCNYAARCPYVINACVENRPQMRSFGEGDTSCIRFPSWRALSNKTNVEGQK